MFSTEHQKLSRPLEKRLATPRLKTTDLEVDGLYCALFVDGCRDHAFFSLGFMLVDDSLNFRFVSSPDSTI